MLACLATFAVLNITAPDEDFIAEDGADIMRKALAFEELQVDAEFKKKHAPGTTLKNIMDFKAFCMGAYVTTRALMQKYPKKGPASAVLDFIAQIGQSGHWEGDGDAKLPANIVGEYVKIMSAMKKVNYEGVNAYVFDRMDDAILRGTGAIKFERSLNAFAASPWGDAVTVGPLVALDKKAMGLTVDPPFVEELAQSIADFDVNRAKVETKCSGADVLASAMFYQNKGKGHYTSFLNREINKVYNKMMREFHIVANYSLHAQVQEFELVYRQARKAVFAQIFKPTNAGYDAAMKKREELAWAPPTMAVLKARAKAHATAWLKRYRAKLPKHGKGHTAALVKKMVDAETGAKIFMKTGVLSNAQSTMRPEVIIKGSARTIKGKIRAVPGAGLSSAQHFASRKGLGKLINVQLKGTGHDHTWFCQKISVRIGPKEIVFLSAGKDTADGFWLNGTQTVTLKPSKKLKRDALKLPATACIGFKSTSGCNATGLREPDDDKSCKATVEGAFSGYCSCGSGIVSRVDCGHAPFTCEELCKAA